MCDIPGWLKFRGNKEVYLLEIHPPIPILGAKCWEEPFPLGDSLRVPKLSVLWRERRCKALVTIHCMEGLLHYSKIGHFFKKMVKNPHVFAAAASDLHHVTELGSFIPLRSHFLAMLMLSRNELVLQQIPHSYILISQIFIKNGAQSVEGKKNKG